MSDSEKDAPKMSPEMVEKKQRIKREFPLHYWVFNHKNTKLEETLKNLMAGQEDQTTEDEAENLTEGEEEEEKEEETDVNGGSVPEEEEEEGSKKDSKSDSDLEEQKPKPGWKTRGGPGESNVPFNAVYLSPPQKGESAKSKRKNDDNVGTEVRVDVEQLLEKKDIRGRTALLLAVTMAHKDCARTLINHNADVFATDRIGFNVFHEAITTNDTGLVQSVVKGMERCRIEATLKMFRNTFNDYFVSSPSFYVEVKCGITGKKLWAGFDDKIKIYKKGKMLRIDWNVPDNRQGTSWFTKVVPGKRSLIFIKSDKDCKLYDVNHQTQSYHLYTYEYEVLARKDNKGDKYAKDDIRNPNREFPIDCQGINELMKHKVKLNIIHTNAMRFKVWPKYSLIGSGQKTQRVNTIYKCSVFSIKGGQRETISRAEHLDKKFNEHHQLMLRMRSQQVSLFDYFDSSNNFKDVGLNLKVKRSMTSYPVTVYMTNQFPLDFRGQIVPIFELMALLKGQLWQDLAKIPLPEGFPLKYELQTVLWKLVKVFLKFVNPNGRTKEVNGVRQGANGADILDSEFVVPRRYHKI